MESEANPQDDEIRMGSEYCSARDYLAQVPRKRSPTSKPLATVRHGSNDSDFGFQKMGGD